MDREVLTSSSS